MLEILQAILLGVLEGFTEFLPISSTGHLVVASEFTGYKDTAKIFAVVIQIGAIAAVIWMYRYDLIKKVRGLYRREPKTLEFWRNWVIATIPAGVVGFIFRHELSVYAISLTVAISLIIGGLIIWTIESFHKAKPNPGGKAHLDQITLKQSVLTGVYQVFALIPGVSRSGATIMGGLLAGMDRVTATAFSFYLSIPILVVAGLYQLVNGRDDFDTIGGGAAALVAGTVAAFITALIVIRWLLRYVSKHDFKIFAYYRIILGVIILIALAFD